MEKQNDNISRRDFIKTMAASGAAVTGLAACAGTSGGDAGSDSTGSGGMTYRTNTNTGDRVSLLGFGMMRLPFIKGRKADDGRGVIDQETVDRMVDYAIEHGVNYFDTSPAYCQGLSELATGQSLSRYPRDRYLVATKLSNFSESTHSAEASRQMYYDSLKFLKVDYIDYYLLHSLSNMDDFRKRYVDNGMMDFLMKERAAGRIRNLGFSYHGHKEFFDYLMSVHDRYHWDFVQIQMNYLDWEYAEKIKSKNTNADYMYYELEKRNIPVVIMEPLLGGRLSRVPENIMEEFKEREPEMSVASWAFRFVGSYPGVLTALSGMTRMEHLEDNLGTYSPLKPLTEDELAFLHHIAHMMMQFKTVPCNDCQYCMPCPYGIDIPGILLHYNKCVNEDNIPTSSGSPEYRKARRAYLVGYDRSVPKLRQADHCTGCGQCNPHCPQGIDIPKELHRIDAYIEKLKQETL